MIDRLYIACVSASMMMMMMMMGQTTLGLMDS